MIVTRPPALPVAVASPFLSIVMMSVGDAEKLTMLVRSFVWPFTVPVTLYCCVTVGPPPVTVMLAIAGLICSDVNPAMPGEVTVPGWVPVLRGFPL